MRCAGVDFRGRGEGERGRGGGERRGGSGWRGEEGEGSRRRMGNGRELTQDVMERIYVEPRAMYCREVLCVLGERKE